MLKRIISSALALGLAFGAAAYLPESAAPQSGIVAQAENEVSESEIDISAYLEDTKGNRTLLRQFTLTYNKDIALYETKENESVSVKNASEGSKVLLVVSVPGLKDGDTADLCAAINGDYSVTDGISAGGGSMMFMEYGFTSTIINTAINPFGPIGLFTLTSEENEFVSNIYEADGKHRFSFNLNGTKIGYSKTLELDSVADSTVKLSKPSYAYSGKEIKPGITITYNGKTLKKVTDYTVTYKNNKKIGTASVIIRGKGQMSEEGVFEGFIGITTKTFKINPKATSIKKVTSPKTKQLKVTYKKVAGVTGYQVTYSTSKKFTKKTTKTVTVKGASKTSKTIKKLKKGKKYYVKVRAYKTVSGKKYYSAYTKVKSIKTK